MATEKDLKELTEKVTEVAKEHGFERVDSPAVQAETYLRLNHLENRFRRIDKSLEKAQYVLYDIMMGLLIAEILSL